MQLKIKKNFFFWLPWIVHGILVPRPGVKLLPPTLEAQSLNHWTTREFPHHCVLEFITCLVSQIHSWKEILPEDESYLQPHSYLI